MDGEDGDAACALGENPVAWEELFGAVKGVPGGEAGAGEGCGFDVVEVGGFVDEALFVVGAVLPECAVYYSSYAALEGVLVERAGDVALVEECDDFISFFETCYPRADFFYDAGAVGACDDVGG